MANRKYVLKIVTDLEKLSDRALEVNPDEPIKNVRSIVKDIKQTLLANKDLYALCAPQIGYNKRIFCIKFKGNKMMTFINPMITHEEGLHLSREINGSISSEYILPRPDSLAAMYQDEHGKITENKFEGMGAELFQQMCQMLDGILISDYGLEVLDGFDDLREEEKIEIINNYKEYLGTLGLKLDTAINKDSTMQKMKEAIDFMTSVAKGETELVPTFNEEPDFSQSTKARIEKENKIDEERKEKILKKIEEIKNR